MAKAGGANRPRFRLLPTVLLTAAILGLPTVVYALGRSSSSFAIHKVAVTGTSLVPERRVQRLLRRDYVGHNLFTVTTADVRQSLAGQRWVEDVRVDRDFPDTLRVEVIEYRPAAYVLAGRQWYVVAEDGYVIGDATAPAGKPTSSERSGNGKPTGSTSATDASPSPSATVTNPVTPGDGATPTTSATSSAGGTATNGATPTAGETPVADSASTTAQDAAMLATLTAGPPGAALRLPRMAVSGRVTAGHTLTGSAAKAGLAVLDGLPSSLRSDVAVVQSDAQGLTTLHFADGPVVVWGDGQRTVAKSLALRAILKRYADAGKDCTFMDVSVPDRVLGRPVLK